MSILNSTEPNGAPFERIIMGPGTPFQTVIREENLNNCIAQLSDLLITDLLLKYFEFTPLTAKIFALSRATPTIGSLLVFPCFGKFVDEEEGDTPNGQPLRIIMDDEETPFEMEDPEQGWLLSDFIDNIGCYIILVTETDFVSAELSTVGRSELVIKGKLVCNLEPCFPKEHSIYTSTCFNLGLEVSLNTFSMVPAVQEVDRVFFGNFIAPPPLSRRCCIRGVTSPRRNPLPSL